MNNKFDELAKGLAQSVTRREAFKKFGIGLAGMALACFGLPRRAKAQTTQKGKCVVNWSGTGTDRKGLVYTGLCVDPNTCQGGFSPDCPAYTAAPTNHVSSVACSFPLGNTKCSF
jgi:hypothetical protein